MVEENGKNESRLANVYHDFQKGGKENSNEGGSVPHAEVLFKRLYQAWDSDD